MHHVDTVLAALERSAFRRRFALSPGDVRRLHLAGRSAIRCQARRIILDRLAPARPPNDGRQTPMQGHPLFLAQHATATCCRRCLNRWHRIPRGAALTETQIDRIVAIIEGWLERQVRRQPRPDGPTGLFDDPADRW